MDSEGHEGPARPSIWKPFFSRHLENSPVRKTVTGLLCIFLLAQFAAMAITQFITVPDPGPGTPRRAKVKYFEDGDDVGSSLYIYAILMGGAALLALAMKLKLGRLVFRNLEALIIFLTTFLFLYSVYPSRPLVWAALSLGVLLLKRSYPHWALVTGLSIYLSAVVGAIIGVSLTVEPVIILMGLLSVYDIVAVNLSSHMSNVVQQVRGTRSAFLVEIPGMKSAIGVSDLAVPSMFVSSALVYNSAAMALGTGLGGAIGLAAAVVYSSRKGMVPALPFIFLGCLGAYSVGIAL
jgi:presenilin-like A22 family membrane protease